MEHSSLVRALVRDWCPPAWLHVLWRRGSGWGLIGLGGIWPMPAHCRSETEGFPREKSLSQTSRPSGGARLSWHASTSAPAGSLDFVLILLFAFI